MNTWILLRGLSRQSGHWGPFTALFEQALQPCRVVALDLPGNGRFHASQSPWSIRAMADHCRAELAAQGIAPPYHLLALSMGGMVATEWASLWPEEISACVLINTSMRPFSPLHHRLRPANYAGLLRLVLTGAPARDWELAILRMTSNHGNTHVIEQWLALRRQHPVTLANTLRQLIAAARYRAPPRKPAVPLLLLASRHDQLVASDCSQAVLRAWGGDLQLHESAGHDLALDDPAWVASQVRHWAGRQ